MDEVQREIPLAGFDPKGEPVIRVVTDGSLNVVFNFMPPSCVPDKQGLGPFHDFDKQMERAIGVPILWDDREFFLIRQPKPGTIEKVRRFVESCRGGAYCMDHLELLIKFITEGAVLPRWNGEKVPVTQQKLGDLRLPSGRVIAVDPVHWGADLSSAAFRFSGAPGTYPVFASLFPLAGHDNVGLVSIRFSLARMFRWEMATRNGEDLLSLKEDEFFGFGVDCGHATYLSLEAGAALRGRDTVIDDLWEQINRAVGGEVIIDGNRELNAVFFETGGGDGFYPSYVAFDEKDQVVLLVTDFGLLDAEIDWAKV